MRVAWSVRLARHEIGRAVEATPAGPHCGVLAVAQKVRYGVLKVLKGKYHQKLIDVIPS